MSIKIPQQTLTGLRYLEETLSGVSRQNLVDILLVIKTMILICYEIAMFAEIKTHNN